MTHAADDCWIGLDCGTGGTRALRVAADGAVCAAASVAHAAIAMPRPLWAEQEPEDWWRAAQAALRQVTAGIAPQAVRGIGLTGQMHGVVLLDARDAVVGPAIIWCDQRAAAEAERLTEAIGAERVLAITGNPLLPAFSAPKLAWLRAHRPGDLDRARRFLLPKDFIRLRLTGERATDAADASGTGLLDVGRRQWSDTMRAALELPPDFLPQVFEGPEIAGRLGAAVAELGLAPGTPVVAGGGDQAAGAVGNGVVARGAAAVTIGTSGVVFAATDRLLRDPAGRVQAFCHAAPGQWHLMGVTQAAGLSLRWFRDQFAPELAQSDDGFATLCDEAATAPPGSDGLLFLPYLLGERSPHLDPAARGAWIGLTAAHRRAHLIRAVLEGVAFSLRDSLDIMAQLGLRPKSLRLSGGGSRGPIWPQIQADVYGLPCERLANSEGAAYGAALLAMVGTGRFPTLAAACAATLGRIEILVPDPERAAGYARQHAVYRQLYPRLRDLYPRLSSAG